MTDQLRDLIAEVHSAHQWGLWWINGEDCTHRCRCGWRQTAEGPTHHEHVADVLIRDLGMTRESTIVYYPGEGVHERPHRYVTSWETE